LHGGGFYHPVKFTIEPPQLQAHLHWFYWESYGTWLGLCCSRCYQCHGEQLHLKNIRVDSPARVAQHTQVICQQVVVTELCR
jgi:uncharacterized membrane protein